MIVGVPKEIRDKESRIALTPEGAKQLASVGHEVLVERSGGLGTGLVMKSTHKAVQASSAQKRRGALKWS